MGIYPCLVVLAASLLAPPVDEKKDDTEVLKAPEARYEPATKPDLPESSQQIIKLTNELRQSKKLSKVEANADLTKAAQGFADYMAETSRYGHKADGKEPAERVKDAGYDYCLMAENIAYTFRVRGFTTDELARKLFTAWKESPKHLENMLDPDVMEMGAAIQVGESGYFFGVQVFGRPKSKAMELRITNQSSATFDYKMAEQKFSLQPDQTRIHRACRRRDFALEWQTDKTQKQTHQPAPGDQLVVKKTGETFEVQKK